jgi:hypothetical protein
LIEAVGDEPSDSRRGLVGIQFADGQKSIIVSVANESPAKDAGIEAGDVVLRVSDYDVATSQEVLAAVAMSRAGDRVPIVVQRGDEVIELNVTLNDHPRQEFAQSMGESGGLSRRGWEFQNDGRLVPLDGNMNAPGQFGLPNGLDQMFKSFPDSNLIVPGQPDPPDETESDGSDPQDSSLDRDDQIEDLKRKLRDLQNKLEES